MSKDTNFRFNWFHCRFWNRDIEIEFQISEFYVVLYFSTNDISFIITFRRLRNETFRVTSTKNVMRIVPLTFQKSIKYHVFVISALIM